MKILTNTLLILGVLSLNFIPGKLLYDIGIGNLLFVSVLLLMLTQGTLWIVRANLLYAFMLMANPYLFVVTKVFMYTRFPFVLLSSVLLIYHYSISNNKTNVTYIKYFVLFILASFLFALINNYYIFVSLLKLTVFGVCSFGFMVAFQNNYRYKNFNLYGWIISFFLSVSILWLLAYNLNVAYMNRGELLYEKLWYGAAGCFNHPQVTGVVTAMFSMFSFLIFLTVREVPVIFSILSFVLNITMCFLSDARSGIFAVCLIILLTLVIILNSKTHLINFRFKKSSIRSGILVTSLCCAFLLMINFAKSDSPVLGNIQTFLYKRDVDINGSFIDKVFSSRAPLIQSSYETFLDNPIIGISFGTSYASSFRDNATLLYAPTEKGFIITAVLEEVGVVGFVIFLMYIVSYLKYTYSTSNLIGVSMFACFLLMNFGEMIFFSFGGTGYICWVLISFSTFSKNLQINNERAII
jgi:hypothetical protein